MEVSMSRTIRTWQLLLIAFAATLASAATDVMLNRGFSANQTFDFHGVDSISNYDGNLTITIPIGQEFHTNGTLKYRFAAVYNSKIWDMNEKYSFITGNGWTAVEQFQNLVMDPGDGPDTYRGSEPVPSRSF